MWYYPYSHDNVGWGGKIIVSFEFTFTHLIYYECVHFCMCVYVHVYVAHSSAFASDTVLLILRRACVCESAHPTTLAMHFRFIWMNNQSVLDSIYTDSQTQTRTEHTEAHYWPM